MAKEAVGEVDLDAIVCLDDMEHAAQRVMDRQDFDSVSYTHLTLPTKA